MLTFNDIQTLKALFHQKHNIIDYIKLHLNVNIDEAILHSYDLQAGEYIKELDDITQKAHKKEIGEKLAQILKKLSILTLCEAGVGEATTLAPILDNISIPKIFGFDISMSRLLYAQMYLQDTLLKTELFCAELSHIPLPNNSIECVYTFHSIEPNGGREKNILSELLRVTQKYLILIEPDYDLFSDEQKTRMDKHGYCKHLFKHLSDLGENIIHYEPWEIDSNPLNKASIIILEKKQSNISPHSNNINFCSPISYEPLNKVSDGLFCKADGFLFPIIRNIPALLRKYGILVSHLEQIGSYT